MSNGNSRDLTPLLYALGGVALCGFLVWLVLWSIPMPFPFDRVLIAVGVIVAILWVLRCFGKV